MSLIDDRGRLFGRVNLIDALVATVALGLIPLSYGVFLMFRPPIPRIIKISPEQIPETSKDVARPRLRITGENLREALVPKFGEILSPGFLVQDSEHGEVIVPDLAVGTYDLSLSDGGRVLLRVPSALTVVPLAVAQPTKVATEPVRSAMALVTVRFVTEPEVLGVVKVGDVDVAGPDTETIRPVLVDIGTNREATSAQIVVESVMGRNSFAVQRPVIAFTGKVRVPVVLAPTGWSFRNRPVKVGAPFSFVSFAAALGGSVLHVSIQARQ